MKLSAYNRYVFLKKLHKRDLIIIKRKEKYYSFSYDKEIFINVNIETDKNVKVKIW